MSLFIYLKKSKLSVLQLIDVWIFTNTLMTFLIKSSRRLIFFYVTKSYRIVIVVSRIILHLFGSDLVELFFFSSAVSCFIYFQTFLIELYFVLFLFHYYHCLYFCSITWLLPLVLTYYFHAPFLFFLLSSTMPVNLFI